MKAPVKREKRVSRFSIPLSKTEREVLERMAVDKGVTATAIVRMWLADQIKAQSSRAA